MQQQRCFLNFKGPLTKKIAAYNIENFLKNAKTKLHSDNRDDDHDGDQYDNGVDYMVVITMMMMIVKTDEDSKDVDDSKDDNGDVDNYSNDDNGDDADNDSNDDM
ncbi:Hypothetical predicted protein, partial [Paramuricea clavata]